jgi:peptidoglycan/xylan/chitin deacetylase (PgdA/CDA1 family)
MLSKLQAAPSPGTATPGFIINFHGLGEPDRTLEPGEGDYWLTRTCYLQTLDMIAGHPLRSKVGVTFDDGNLSDLSIGAGALLERRMAADFFILAGKLGQTGYLARADVRELFDMGFGIGTHGMNHVRWDKLDPVALREEITSSRRILEDIIGAPVVTAGLPFGRYNWRVLQALRRLRFKRVYSSDGAPRLSASWPIPRCSVGLHFPTREVIAQAHIRLRVASRLKVEMRVIAKSLRP